MSNVIIWQFYQKVQYLSQTFQAFHRKCRNDLVMSLAAGLAYHVINALLPLATALFAALGFTIGRIDPGAYTQLTQVLLSLFPTPLPSQNMLEPALTAVRKEVDLLMIIVLFTAIFGGSRLFIAIEGAFAIMYRTRRRKTIPRYLMATLMLCIFIVLTPLMFFASFLPALILLFLENTTLNHLPGVTQLARHGVILSMVSVLESLIVTWVLFVAIYMVVPNRKIHFKQSWKGALAAALLLEIFLTLFPFYITHFMGSYTGFIGLFVITMFFFYYVSVILLMGAEVNAFYAEGIHALPDSLINLVSQKMSEEEQGDMTERDI